MNMKCYSVQTYSLALSGLLMLNSPALAATIISPVSAVIDNGGPGFGSINDTLNQNGLNSGFTSGVTDYDTYIATAPTHSFIFAGMEWFSNSPPPASPTVVTYDLGATFPINALALWNEESSGIATLDLATSVDGVSFSNLVTGLTPIDNNSGDIDYAVESIPFATTNAQYVRFTMTGPTPDSDFDAVAIGEVAFRVENARNVTDGGSTMALLGCGLLGLCVAKRKGSRKTNC